MRLLLQRPLLVLAILASNVLLSVYFIIADPVVNNDAIIYMHQAEMILQGEWRQTFDVYSWPYYSVCIAVVSKLTGLPLEASAHVLNVLFLFSLCLAFLAIVDLLADGNNTIVFIAALILLLFPSINKYRSFIIRDFAYLSFYLWSLYFLLRFCQRPQKTFLLAWLATAIISCLFRFEGIFFVLIAPYFLIQHATPKLPHRRLVLASLCVFLVSCCAALIWWYLDDKYATMLLAADNQQGSYGLLELFADKFRQRYPDQAITVVQLLEFTASNIGFVMYELLRRMAVLYLPLALFALVYSLALNPPIFKRVWQIYLAINLLTLIGFGLYNDFLVSRYTLATALTLLILCPFAIDYFWRSRDRFNRFSQLLMLLAVVALIAVSAERFGQRSNKMHLRSGGEWLAENTKKSDLVYANEPRLLYYANRNTRLGRSGLYPLRDILSRLRSNKLFDVDYIAVEINVASYDDNVRSTFDYHFGLPTYIAQRDEDFHVFIWNLKKRYNYGR